MPYTLSEYKASSENALDRRVIDEFRGSEILERLPFDDGAHLNAGGSAWVYAYDRVTTLPDAATRAVNTEYTPQEAKTTKISTELKIFGGSFEVDRTQIGTARYGDRIAFQLGQKIKATRAKFHDLLINGDSGATITEFDGLDALLAGSSTEYTPAAPIDLGASGSIDTNYKAFLDQVFEWLASLDGTPDALLMNRTMRARMRSIASRAGYLTQSEDAFGRNVAGFDGIPMLDPGDKPASSNPVIAIDSVAKTTSVFAVRFALDGVHGVAPTGNNAFIRTYLPDLAQPGAVKKGEVEMVSAIALKATRSAGVFRDVKVAA